MNRHVLRAEIAATETGFAAISLAFLSLARTQRRLAGEYRRWAREAEADGKLEQYRRYAGMARETFRAGLEHLSHARHYRDLSERNL